MDAPTQADYAYEQRNPNSSEIIPLVQKLVQGTPNKSWHEASSICVVHWNEERLLLVSPAGDAFVAVYFEGQDQENRLMQIKKVVSNGNAAALLMLLQLIWHFKL